MTALLFFEAILLAGVPLIAVLAFFYAFREPVIERDIDAEEVSRE